MLIPDHTPQLSVDSAEQWAACAFAVGYINQAIRTLRGCCELSSRKVFLPFNSSSVG
jgi:hypothetical protein